MSPLPERRKTAEELAALRASLGVPGEEGEAVPAPVATPAADPVVAEPEPVMEEPEEPREPETLVCKSLKRAERGEFQVKPKPRASGGKLPTRRHSPGELQRLRLTDSGAAVDHAAHLRNLGARWWTISIIYAAGCAGPLLAWLGVSWKSTAAFDLPGDWARTLVRRDDLDMILFGLLAAGAAIMLVGAGWIAWRRKRSAWHSAVLTITAVLVLTFGILYFFPELHGA